jgi:hypothetical protein
MGRVGVRSAPFCEKRRVCAVHRRVRARQNTLDDNCLIKCSQNDRLDYERVLIFEPHAVSKGLA